MTPRAIFGEQLFKVAVALARWENEGNSRIIEPDSATILREMGDALREIGCETTEEIFIGQLERCTAEFRKIDVKNIELKQPSTMVSLQLLILDVISLREKLNQMRLQHRSALELGVVLGLKAQFLSLKANQLACEMSK